MRRLLALLLFIFISAAAQAGFLYRMDTRPPEVIFQNGFTPGGNNPSLFQHVVGHTCRPGVRSTGFIAASANETFAIHWGRENLPAGTHFYVYRIRASEHFYNAAQSLFHASRQANDMAYEVAGWMYMGESEWLTPVAIPPQDVLGAVEYITRGYDEPPQQLTTYIPAGARDTPGVFNHQPFTWDYTLDSEASIPPSLSPCPAVCFGSGHSRRKRSTTTVWVDDIGGDDEFDEARRKSNHIIACMGRTAAALLNSTLLPDPPPPAHEPKTEL